MVHTREQAKKEASHRTDTATSQNVQDCLQKKKKGKKKRRSRPKVPDTAQQLAVAIPLEGVACKEENCQKPTIDRNYGFCQFHGTSFIPIGDQAGSLCLGKEFMKIKNGKNYAIVATRHAG